jgi:hypothetical protein
MAMSSNNPSKLFDRLLSEAEERFGPRSRALNPTVMPRDNVIPETVQNEMVPDACFVYFAREAEGDYQRLRFQLAHEAIHVLSGVLKRDALKLEEGFAVWFSLNHRKVKEEYRRRAYDSLPPLFKDALKFFRRMKPTDSTIKQLRYECRFFDNVRPESLTKIFSVSGEHARKILQRVPKEMHARLA